MEQLKQEGEGTLLSLVGEKKLIVVGLAIWYR